MCIRKAAVASSTQSQAIPDGLPVNTQGSSAPQRSTRVGARCGLMQTPISSSRV